MEDYWALKCRKYANKNFWMKRYDKKGNKKKEIRLT